MYYIYFLYSTVSDIYYVGYTDDVNRRLMEHNELSETSFTSKHRPWILKGQYAVGNERGMAMKIERHIKKQKSRVYIERILENGKIDKLIERFSPVG